MRQKITPSQPARGVSRAAGWIAKTVCGWLDSPRFFWVIVGLLTFQALWIALTARYPQAFDEEFHFGLIQAHAHQWLPFFTQQPPLGEVQRAVVRDPSYLYHYLLSLVYRLITVFTHSLPAEVIILRILNIGMFVGGLIVFRALLDRLGISRRVRNTALFFFVLTPVVPLLAAHINYDNLVFLLTGVLFLYAVRFMQQLRLNHTVDIPAVIWIIFYGLLTGLVKYTTLPVTAAVVIVMLYLYVRDRRDSVDNSAFVKPSRTMVLLLAIPIVIMLGLAGERYGINIARYHSLSPNCAKVLSARNCAFDAVWERDYQWSQIYPHPSLQGIIVYPFVWIHRMVFETLFTISSRFDTNGLVVYIPAPPLTVLNYTAWFVVITGLAAVVWTWRTLWRRHELRYLLLVSVFYTVTLFVKNFSMYIHSGEAVAIHGRYLIPVYPLLFAATIIAISQAFQRLGRPNCRISYLLLIALLMTQGAGLITWIYRSDPSWYWSRGSHVLVYAINRPVQNVIHRIIIP